MKNSMQAGKNHEKHEKNPSNQKSIENPHLRYKINSNSAENPWKSPWFSK
jgi:hypothetical protein